VRVRIRGGVGMLLLNALAFEIEVWQIDLMHS
jgi:hypothetical protein